MGVVGLNVGDWMLISAVASTVALAFGIAWARSLRRVRELERHLLERDSMTEPPSADEITRRLDDVSAQVDRLADGQDFLSRLVAERRSDVPRGISEPLRASTPH